MAPATATRRLSPSPMWLESKYSRAVLNSLTFLAGLSVLGGCASTANTAQLLPQAGATVASEPPVRWLDSARLVHAVDFGRQRPQSTTRLVSHEEPTDQTALKRVLAIQYPHPNGRRDIALVELVVVEWPIPQQESQWRRSLTAWFDSFLPGVSWVDGVQQAKSMTVPVAELESLMAEVGPGAPLRGGGVHASGGRLEMEINGQIQQRRRIDRRRLNDLAVRVLREGKLISYHGTVESFFQQSDEIALPQRLPPI